MKGRLNSLTLTLVVFEYYILYFFSLKTLGLTLTLVVFEYNFRLIINRLLNAFNLNIGCI